MVHLLLPLCKRFYAKKIFSVQCLNHGIMCHFSSSERRVSNKQRFNQINIQMLSHSLYRQIFGDIETTKQTLNSKTLHKVLSHLKAHDIYGSETSILPDVEFSLPKLQGSNISEHFKNIAEELCKDYKTLLFQLSDASLPPLPSNWKFSHGWTCYNSDGTSFPVDVPNADALVFDVEVCMSEGNYPTLAAAVSKDHWYLWCSGRLVKNQFLWSDGISLDDLIPLEKCSNEVELMQNKPKLIIGHNVGFDRSFIKEQYLLQRTNTYFLDTMSLHICISGLTGLQRAMSIAYKREMSHKSSSEFSDVPVGWIDITSLNNLADVYTLYCDDVVLEKSKREVFISGSLADIQENFQELATYCAQDVLATHKVMKEIISVFFERFPHPVTFAGLLEMSSVYLPINQNWKHYLHETQSTYEDLQKELKFSLIHLANDACSLLHDNIYKNDPWLWDLDWSVQEMKFKKSPLKVSKKKKVNEVIVNDITPTDEMKWNQNEDQENSESCIACNDATQNTINYIYETAASLRKIRPFLPGYPSWYRALCEKYNPTESEWEPGPILISSQMRCVPKLMRLTWDGFPLHYDNKHGWGYLVPDASSKENCNDQPFPIKQLWALFSENRNGMLKEANEDIMLDSTTFKELQENPNETSKLWQTILGINLELKNQQTFQPLKSNNFDHYGIGPYDVGIPGCFFYRMPHKDGPHKRVGNPLSKDFLSKVEDGTLKSWGRGQADRALLLSKMLSYWKNSHSRIMSQMTVWLKQNELPKSVICHVDFDESNQYGAILPRLIPAGTVTRRAVEPTWLTASNAYSDRVGSELKSMIQAPPGYHFIGADVDSQELWIAAILGDSQFAKLHGCTAFGWMTLQGKKSLETDMHSRTAKSVGITRNQAKVLNYARIYGAGKAFAQRLLMQFNHRLSPAEAKAKVKKIYSETKGTRKSSFHEDVGEDEDAFINAKSQRKWIGGSESHLFNKLEEIAVSAAPQTPILKCRISRALEPKAVDTNFMTSRVNWVVQSSAVDYLHLMLVSMKWLFKHYKIEGRLSICIHDEVRYLVSSHDRYRAALALQITNLWTRCIFAYELGMYDLPQSVAFFSSVDIDLALRKEVDMDSVTPSNPHGLKKSYGIPPGESLNIYAILQKNHMKLSSVT